MAPAAMKKFGFLLVMALLMSACNRMRSLSGDVFVPMASGDVKRGADTEVSLIPATPEFEQEWKNTVDARDSEEARAMLVKSAAELNVVRAKNEQLKAAIAANNASLGTQAYLQASALQLSMLKVAEAAQQQVLEARLALSAVSAKYVPIGESIIQRYRARGLRTDVNGHYKAEAIPIGRYYVVAKFTVFKKSVGWFVPIEIARGRQTLDLSLSNAGKMPFLPPNEE